MQTRPYKIILFPGGCSGNFLADWLTLNEATMREPTYQIIDDRSTYRWIRLPNDTLRSTCAMVLDLKICDDEEIKFLKERIKILKDKPNTDVTISHITDERLLDLIDFPAKIITIWFKSDVYTSIRNNYFKTSTDSIHKVDPRISYFEHIYNFISYQYDIKTKLPIPNDCHDLLDILNIDYLIKLYKDVNEGTEPSQFKIDWANEYIDKQRVIKFDSSTGYEELKRQLQPADIFDLAILLHAFETRNQEKCRIWSIDDVPLDFESALVFFDNNHDRYY